MFMINPSYFEGWSTTVEEGKSFSKRLILSDINVHREQSPNSLFFNPNSPEELANCIEKEWSEEQSLVDWENTFFLNQEKVQDFGKRAYSILEEAIQIFR
jgi:glycosyltransferase involved in cell wall biosynthesis